MIVGDVLNAYGYRVRPYEKMKGDTNKKLTEAKGILYKALEDLLARADVPLQGEQAAQAEYERALQENGVTREQVAAFLEANPKFRSPFYKAKHVYCGNNADVVAAVAPYITKTRAERWKDRVAAFVTGSKQAIEKTPHLAVSLVEAVKEAPKVAERVKEDITILRELRALKKKAPKVESTLDAAAEE